MLPAPVIHWMPNSAAFCSLTSTIRLSTSTCARRWSSWSITSRRLRYSGSGAEMISELVAGSAWMVAPPAEYDTAWAALGRARHALPHLAAGDGRGVLRAGAALRTACGA
ncbi:hypothetical protein G6F65_022261 [Rhizopus arrhizus]|nr:hypothetical protein G6F65_022261 [Rhizopus arrhizus]